nr:putative capsid protein [Picobirnavirus sp.]
MYAATMADIYSFVVFAQRLYNYCYMLSQRNYYIAEALIKSCGFDPTALCSSLANFRYWLNAFIAKVQSFAVPADIYFFKRRAFLYANFYTENSFGNLKDQLYHFIPSGFYKFELDTDNQSAGCLKFKPASWSLANLGNLISYGNDLLSNITGDEDFGLMSGDILKAYGPNGIIMLGNVPEEGGILPVYDPWVLSQFKNASVIVPSMTDTYTIGTYTFKTGNLYQDANGNLVSKEVVDSLVRPANQYIYLKNNKLLTVENPEPGEGDVIEATRLMCGYVSATGAISSGTEIVVGVFEYIYRAHGSFGGTFTPKILDHVTNDTTVIVTKAADPSVSNWDSNVSTELSITLMFKYAPYRMIAVLDANNRKLETYYPFSNLDNTTIITNEQLERLHECALLSLFYVPGVAKLI